MAVILRLVPRCRQLQDTVILADAGRFKVGINMFLGRVMNGYNKSRLP